MCLGGEAGISRGCLYTGLVHVVQFTLFSLSLNGLIKRKRYSSHSIFSTKEFTKNNLWKLSSLIPITHTHFFFLKNFYPLGERNECDAKGALRDSGKEGRGRVLDVSFRSGKNALLVPHRVFGLTRPTVEAFALRFRIFNRKNKTKQIMCCFRISTSQGWNKTSSHAHKQDLRNSWVSFQNFPHAPTYFLY